MLRNLTNANSLSQARFAHDSVEVLTNSRVKEVRSDRIFFSQQEDGKTVTKEIPMGFCLWSTGVCKFVSLMLLSVRGIDLDTL